jgi:hypothetical protein
MKVSRRDFFVTTAAAGVGAAALGAETTPPAVAPEASARFEWIMKKWGAGLTPEQEADIKRLITDNVKGLETMRAYLLTNDVEPSR